MEHTGTTLQGKRLVLGVTGSIAAYKAAGLLRTLTREGADVTVVMTQSATQFVTPLTFEVLSGKPVVSGLFQGHQEITHLAIPEQAHAIVIAPATANFLAKAAVGLADDALSTMLLGTRCPLIVAPAMDGDMWGHPTVVQHVRTLRSRGVMVLDPEIGSLASGLVAQGRLASELRLLDAVIGVLTAQDDWRGQRVLVSAGPTQEAIDPVRFISNRSSGKMGYAIAEAARRRGAEVVLVSGPTSLTPLHGVQTISVTTAGEMEAALSQQFPSCTVLIMAAAVADFRPKVQATQKLKKRDQTGLMLELESAPDILSMLSAKRTSQVLVGFAAETERLLSHAAEKLRAKGLDLIIANDVTREGGGFGSDENAVTILCGTGQQKELALMPKHQLADEILTVIREVCLGPRLRASVVE